MTCIKGSVLHHVFLNFPIIVRVSFVLPPLINGGSRLYSLSKFTVLFRFRMSSCIGIVVSASSLCSLLLFATVSLASLSCLLEVSILNTSLCLRLACVSAIAGLWVFRANSPSARQKDQFSSTFILSDFSCPTENTEITLNISFRNSFNVFSSAAPNYF